MKPGAKLVGNGSGIWSPVKPEQATQWHNSPAFHGGKKDTPSQALLPGHRDDAPRALVTIQRFLAQVAKDGWPILTNRPAPRFRAGGEADAWEGGDVHQNPSR